MEKSKNRFGISLNANGGMLEVWEWPWFWRYPIAIVGECAVFWFVVYLATNNHAVPWVYWTVGCVGTIASLSVVYELFLLLVFAGIIWGAVSLAQLILPDTTGVNMLPILSFAVIIYVAHQFKKSDDDAKKWRIATTYKMEELIEKIDRLEQICAESYSRDL